MFYSVTFGLVSETNYKFHRYSDYSGDSPSCSLLCAENTNGKSLVSHGFIDTGVVIKYFKTP